MQTKSKVSATVKVETGKVSRGAETNKEMALRGRNK